MTSTRTIALAGAATLLVLAGCAGSQPEATPSPPVTPVPTETAATLAPTPTETTVRPDFTPMPDLTIAPDPGTLPSDGVPDAVAARTDVQQAVADEAARAGVRPDDVELTGYAQVTWSDGSLGCPEPGVMYTQALVPGRQLILSVDGVAASYHASLEGPFRYCPTPVPPSADPGTR